MELLGPLQMQQSLPMVVDEHNTRNTFWPRLAFQTEDRSGWRMHLKRRRAVPQIDLLQGQAQIELPIGRCNREKPHRMEKR
jgi:hypothetical protein